MCWCVGVCWCVLVCWCVVCVWRGPEGRGREEVLVCVAVLVGVGVFVCVCVCVGVLICVGAMVCVCVCVGVCVCVREGPRPSRNPSSPPSRGFKGLPSEILKDNPSRLHLCALLPSPVVDTIRFEPPPKIWSPFPPEVDIELFFSFFRFRFSFFFFLIFFGWVLFFSFWSPVPLFFCFFFFFGRLCPVFFLGRSDAPEPNFVPVLAWGPKGGCPKPEKVGARRVGAEGWKPEGWRPEGWERFKISLFVTLSRRKFSLFSSLYGGLLVELWPRFKAVAHPKSTFGLLWGHFVRAPRRGDTLKLFAGLNGLKSVMCSRSA